MWREINAIVPAAPRYLKYVDTAITWDRTDHPDHIPDPGSHALVVSPIVENTRLRKVLMDGGARINLLYLSTLLKLHLLRCDLKHSNVKFHGIVPGI